MSHRILPFYLVCDESGSMAGAPLDEINNAMPQLCAAVAADPAADSSTRFCLIGFAEQARVLLPLAGLGSVRAVPELGPAGQTHYGRVFGLLRDTIEADVRRLAAAGELAGPPVVFFLSDGLPTDDDWQQAYGSLTDEGWAGRPDILAFGFGDADMNTICAVATVRAFVADGSRNVVVALREFGNSLIRTIVDSGARAELALPERVPGFTVVAPARA
jgi:uncharacterized protein YegL